MTIRFNPELPLAKNFLSIMISIRFCPFYSWRGS